MIKKTLLACVLGVGLFTGSYWFSKNSYLPNYHILTTYGHTVRSQTSVERLKGLILFDVYASDTLQGRKITVSSFQGALTKMTAKEERDNENVCIGAVTNYEYTGIKPSSLDAFPDFRYNFVVGSNGYGNREGYFGHSTIGYEFTQTFYSHSLANRESPPVIEFMNRIAKKLRSANKGGSDLKIALRNLKDAHF